jgi:pyruvate formate lyase activating enzyme
MKIGGVHWTTVLDYPGLVAATVFAAGCNLRCPFCHNPELVLPELVARTGYEMEEPLFLEMESRKGFLDGVVISGGEPTLQPDLADILGRLRSLGLRVKLDTNGTRPRVLKEILEMGLVDYVAMDVKAPWDRYAELTGGPVDVDAVKASAALIPRLAPQYEFRTTVAPGLSAGDLTKIAEQLPEAETYWLQLFQCPEGKRLVKDDWRARISLEKHDLDQAWEILQDRFRLGGVRG